MRKPNNNRSIVISSLFIALIGFFALRILGNPKPVHLADSAGHPYWISQIDDAWYFVDSPAKGRERLVRATKSGSETLVSAEKIGG